MSADPVVVAPRQCSQDEAHGRSHRDGIDADKAEVGKWWLERCMLDGMAEVPGPDAPVSVEISVSDDWSEK